MIKYCYIDFTYAQVHEYSFMELTTLIRKTAYLQINKSSLHKLMLAINSLGFEIPFCDFEKGIIQNMIIKGDSDSKINSEIYGYSQEETETIEKLMKKQADILGITYQPLKDVEKDKNETIQKSVTKNVKDDDVIQMSQSELPLFLDDEGEKLNLIDDEFNINF